MPTARELLEQADALMRRNRAAAAAAEVAKPAAAPLPPPSVAPGATASPRTIQREPIAPSLARTSLPVDPSESPFIVPGLDASRQAVPRQAALRDDADVPVLTDAVAEAAEADDVPVLTDAVDEIDVSEVREARAEGRPLVEESARGEISFWLDAQDADASLLGPAPDSVAVVPPPDLSEAPPAPPEVPPPGRDPLGFDQPAPAFRGTLTSDAAPADEALVPDEPMAEAPVMAPDEGETEPPPSVEEIEVRPFAAAADVGVEPAWDEPRSPAATLESAEDGASIDSATRERESAAIDAARVPSADEARIREIAEEIGMQVLQRIDIFTDTGLRERLGERLKPVIERVSADLVDALNQHVGELLREYVAEAIEREIETWRERRGP